MRRITDECIRTGKHSPAWDGVCINCRSVEPTVLDKLKAERDHYEHCDKDKFIRLTEIISYINLIIQENDALSDALSDASQECLLLEKQNDKMKVALQFYADATNWVSNSGKTGYGIGLKIYTNDFENVPNDRSTVRYAGGMMARKVLKEIEE